jgi:DNA-binding MarR family transcriptional regulator
VAAQGDKARVGAWWTFMAAHALLSERVDRDLTAATSLCLGSYKVLDLLHDAAGGRLRLSELAKAVHLTRSGVTRLTNRLEKKGFVRREKHARDRRGTFAVLTGRGREELRRARGAFVLAIVTHFGVYLSDSEAKALNAILSRMVKAETGADYQ